MATNLILDADSYKHSHWQQYPEEAKFGHSYVESRGGEYPEIRVFGPQMFIKKFFLNPITMQDVEEAKEVTEAHGEPFNYEGWKYIVEKHGGKLPLVIKSVPEGTVVPTKNVVLTVENTDPNCVWLPSFVETALLRGVWYPSTVATTSWRIKQIIKRYLEETGDPSGLPFKLHDFGGRGVSSEESAQIGGLAHLTNFMGTDTMSALVAGRRYYHAKMAGFSIPAAEHSTMTALGRDGEKAQFTRMIQKFSGPSKIFAMVSDSYDIFKAVDTIGTELKPMLLQNGGTLVVRPDSGNPTEVVLRVVQQLDHHFGSEVNPKGFKVLHPSVRVIQGDGINEKSIEAILATLTAHGYSADNVAFGMGGALLQAINRDTCKWAMKCSAMCIDGVWLDVFKDPITDQGKTSKKGRLELYKVGDGYVTGRIDERPAGAIPMLREIFRDGQLLVDETLDIIRERQ